MKLGIQMYGVMAGGGITPEEALKTVKKVGLCMVEPCINFDEDYQDRQPAFWSVGKFEKLFPLINELGLSVATVFVNTSSLLKAAPSMCELAKRYQIPYFILGMPSGLSKEGLERASELYIQLADRLSASGAKPLIHNGKPDTEVMIDGKTAYGYMAKLCEGKVGLEFDTGWGAAGGIDPIAFIKENDTFIEALHFKDFIDPGKPAKDIYIGGGSVDNRRALSFGLKKGIPLFVDQDNYLNLEEDMRKSLEFLENGGKTR